MESIGCSGRPPKVSLMRNTSVQDGKGCFITAGSSGKRRSVIKASLVVLHGDAMSYLIHRRTQVLARFHAAFFSGLLVGGLASCSGGNSNSGAQPTLTLTPSSVRLTAGAAGQQASLLLTAPALAGGGTAPVTVSGLPAGVTISPSTLAVTPGTAASGAGVQPGDILQKVNGKVPPPLYELDKLLALPGASITITILRSGKQKTMTIHLRRLV